MNGRVIATALVAVTILLGVALWWTQTRAWYREVEGLDVVLIGGRGVPVAEYRGLDGESSPLKLRGCFRLDPQAVDAPPAEGAQPLTTPGWFECYDAETLAADLDSGRARAVVAERDDPEGLDRIVAVYPDGRAYQWRRVREPD